MKTRLFIFFALAALAIAGCKKPEEPTPGPTPGGDEDAKCLAVEASLPQGSTVVWKTDDRIAVDGKMSDAIKAETDGVGKTSATFKFSADLGKGTYKALYPLSAIGFEGGALDMTKLTVKGTQQWTAGTFDPAANYMIGTGSEGTVAFKYANAFIKLTVTGNRKVSKITFTSKGTVPASGKFTVNYATGALTPADEFSESNSSIVLDCAKATASTTIYYIAIPAQTYPDGYTVKIEDANDNYVENDTNTSYTAVAGAEIEISKEFNDDEREDRLTLDASVPQGSSVEWKSDDSIAVDGQISASVETKSNGVATFTFSADLGDGPYQAAYPASAVKSTNDVLDMETLTVSGAQQWTANTFDPTANYMVGTGTEGAVAFKHVTAFIKLTVTGTNTVNKITFTSKGSVPACGDFTVDYENGAIAPAGAFSESNSSIVLDCANAAEGTSIYYIAIPAQTYSDGFIVKIEDADGNYVENVTSTSSTAAAGAEIELSKTFNKVFALNASVPQGSSVAWKSDDSIAVDGQVSESVETKADGVAKFTFPADPGNGSYQALYPASAVKSTNDVLDMETLTVSGTQQWTANTFDPAANYMVGTGSNGAVAFNHASAFIKIPVTGTMTVSKITFTSNGTVPACGEFTVDYGTGLLTPAEEFSTTNSSIVLDCSAASAASPYWIAIPAQTYSDGFTVKIEDADGVYIKHVESSSQTATAGSVITITDDGEESVDFSKFVINDLDDWKAFVAGVKTGVPTWAGKDAKIVLAKDLEINVADEAGVHLSDASVVYDFGGEFDGCGYKITRSKSTRMPLFGKVSGTVKNINLHGVAMTTPGSAAAETGGAATLAAMVDGGTIDNCHNYIPITIGTETAGYASSTICGALVTRIKSGTITGCTNNAAITVNLDCAKNVTTTLRRLCIGGIVGSACGETSRATISSCENKAAITVYAIENTSSPKGLGLGCSGGILGQIDMDNVTVTECTNSAAITVGTNLTTTAAAYPFACGGIIGMGAKISSSKIAAITADHYYAEVTKCTNNGNILNKYLSKGDSKDPLTKIYAGGIAGTLLGTSGKHSKVTECKNYGSVTPDTTNVYIRTGCASVAGGILGLGGYADLSKCEVGTVDTPVSIGTSKAYSFSAGGGIGLAVLSFKMNECKINATIEHMQTSVGNGAHALGAAIKSDVTNLALSNSEITNCKFNGSIVTRSISSSTGVINGSTSAATTETAAVGVLYEYPATYTDEIAATKGVITLSGNALWE